MHTVATRDPEPRGRQVHGMGQVVVPDDGRDGPERLHRVEGACLHVLPCEEQGFHERAARDRAPGVVGTQHLRRVERSERDGAARGQQFPHRAVHALELLE
ncbi:hypothetical protein MN0502_27450 [Arthrobacter sp. MN05-02]|nr:hypothetical protein MN0502_27450 [Arthrobacter sp. MN05-02]